jgi:hypothetical protein
MRSEERLPLAFGAWIARAAREAGDARLSAIGMLEHAMAQLRRADERPPILPPAACSFRRVRDSSHFRAGRMLSLARCGASSTI